MATQADNRGRIRSAAGVAALHALLGYAFLTGLRFDAARMPGDALKLFDVRDLPPPPASVPAETTAREAEGAASPPNRTARPSAVVAPPPEIRLPVPPPIAAAPAAGPGSESAAGAAPVEGPGTGRGGTGAGLGSGRAGSGTGGGAAARARLLDGDVYPRDYPRAARGSQGKVGVRIAIGVDGRVSGCAVTRSSGNAALDDTSCRLIAERYRYAPARDADGLPVPDVHTETHTWWTGRPPRSRR